MTMEDGLESMLQSLPALLKQREEALEEREQELQRLRTTLKKEYPNLGHSSDVLRLNVGGKRIDVLRQTLTQVPGSMLESKFSGRWDDSLEKDVDGNIFIDQPDHLFVPLINYLRAKQCETPLATPALSPVFDTTKDAKDFQRMVEYYGISLAVYPVGLYRFNSDWTLTFANSVECRLDSGEWSTFCLQPYSECHYRRVKSFEIAFEHCASAQIGWIDLQYLDQYRESESGRGVGYGNHSMSLDCVKSGLALNGSFTPLLCDAVSVKECTIIRSEEFGMNWYVDGELAASTNKKGDNVLEFNASCVGTKWVPCLSVKGSCKIAKVELEF